MRIYKYIYIFFSTRNNHRTRIKKKKNRRNTLYYRNIRTDNVRLRRYTRGEKKLNEYEKYTRNIPMCTPQTYYNISTQNRSRAVIYIYNIYIYIRENKKKKKTLWHNSSTILFNRINHNDRV